MISNSFIFGFKWNIYPPGSNFDQIGNYAESPVNTKHYVILGKMEDYEDLISKFFKKLSDLSEIKILFF